MAWGIESIVLHYRSSTGPGSDWQTKHRYRILPMVNLFSLVILACVSILSFIRFPGGGGGGSDGRGGGGLGVWHVFDKHVNRMTQSWWVFTFLIPLYWLLALWLSGQCYLGLFCLKDNRLYNERVGFLFSVICLAQCAWYLLWNQERLVMATLVHVTCVLIPLSIVYSRLRVDYGLGGRHRTIRREFTDFDDVLLVGQPVEPPATVESSSSMISSEQLSSGLSEPMMESESSRLHREQQQQQQQQLMMEEEHHNTATTTKYRVIRHWEIALFYVTFSAYLSWAVFQAMTCTWTTMRSLGSPNDRRFLLLNAQAWSIVCHTSLSLLTVVIFVMWRRDPVFTLVSVWNMGALYGRQNDLVWADGTGESVRVSCILNLCLLSTEWVLLLGYLALEHRWKHAVSLLLVRTSGSGGSGQRSAYEEISDHYTPTDKATSTAESGQTEVVSLS